MIGILSDLFYGNITPFSAIFPKCEEYRKGMDQICAEENYWKERLSPMDFEKLEKLVNTQGEVAALVQEETFAYAFSLGALVACEVFSRGGEIAE